MSVSDKEIIESCWELLSPENFLTAYQIWHFLKEEGNPLCQALENDYGTAVGKGGGAPVGPAQRIAQALGRSDHVRTYYLDTRDIIIADIKPSGLRCGLFCIMELGGP